LNDHIYITFKRVLLECIIISCTVNTINRRHTVGLKIYARCDQRCYRSYGQNQINRFWNVDNLGSWKYGWIRHTVRVFETKFIGIMLKCYRYVNKLCFVRINTKITPLLLWMWWYCITCVNEINIIMSSQINIILLSRKYTLVLPNRYCSGSSSIPCKIVLVASSGDIESFTPFGYSILYLLRCEAKGIF